MTPEELAKLVALVAQLSSLVLTQYNKYKDEQNLTDEQMKAHLKDLNKEDAEAFDAILAASSASN